MSRAQISRPIAALHPQHRVFHGDDFVDNYEWLRDNANPEVVKYFEDNNAYTEARTEHLAGLRDDLFTEISERTVETDMSVPSRQGNWWYFTRTHDGAEYWQQCRVPAGASWVPPEVAGDTALPGEEIVFDANAAAAGHEFFSVGTLDISTDGNWLLYGVDTKGDERYELHIRDLRTGVDLPDVITSTAAGASLSKDAQYVFYATVDEAWRPDKIWRHKVGDTAVSNLAGAGAVDGAAGSSTEAVSNVATAGAGAASATDTLILHEPDESYWCDAGGVTRSGEYYAISVGSKVTDELLIAPANDPLAEFTPVWPRVNGIEYNATHAIVGGKSVFVILHNRNAPNGEAVVVDAADPTVITQVLLPHSTDRRIEAVSAYRNFLVVHYREHGLTQVGTIAIDSGGFGPLRPLKFESELYTVSAGGSDWSQPNLRVSYTDLVTPAKLMLTEIGSDTFTLLKQKQVKGGFDPANYQQARAWATAADGSQIPISLVWREIAGDPADHPHDRPLMLYGYGSYEISIDPGFSIPRLSLLDRGVVYAIAHIRGGGEMGRAWYDNGKGLHKRNTFTDFVDSAKYLIATEWTTPRHLAALGGSAGGLLMGAVCNLAPELFTAIHADVPFVDALTSILKPELPLTVIEWDEWGDPYHDAEVYSYMRGYSPYENVRSGVDYPHVLATTSLNDTRVLCVEPAKWVAALTAAGHDALLQIEMNAGHGGVSGKYASWREVANYNSWLLDQIHAVDRIDNV